MLAKSKFEQGLDLLEQAIPLLRQAYAEQETAIRQGIIATISGGGQTANGGSTTPPARSSKSETGKAPRGAARAFVKKLLAGTKRGMVWGDIEEAAKSSGEITHWAVRKEINKGRKEGRYVLRSGRWALKEEVA